MKLVLIFDMIFVLLLQLALCAVDSMDMVGDLKPFKDN